MASGRREPGTRVPPLGYLLMLRKFQRLSPFICRQWRILAAIASLTVVSSLFTAVQPWPLKLLIDAIATPGHPATALKFLEPLAGNPVYLIIVAALASVGVFALSTIVSSVLTWAWTLFGQRIVFDLATALFHRLQRVSFTYHHRNSIGDSLSRISGDAWCIYTLTSQLFSPGEQVFTLATIGVVAWRLNPQLAAISLGASPVLALSNIYFGRRLKARARANREAESRLASFVHQTLSSMPVVQAFATEDRNSRRFEVLAADAVAVSQKRSIVASAQGFVNGMITTTGAALVTFFGAHQVLAGHMSLGSLVVFITYVRAMQTAAEGLLKTYGDMKPVEASVDRVLEVLEPSADEPSDAPGARALPERRDAPRVVFDNVTFGYEPRRPVLSEVSFEVPPGAMIAIVGATGAGKSSLVSLLPRFYDPWQGRVLMDGEDVRSFTLASLRRQIGLVLQEPFLSPLSVADNIGYGKSGATREEIIRAAELAQADAFIRALPEGYDTVIGEYGATLSGGEKQRIAIARAILKDAPVLILDEPTSALDARTEAGLMKALDRLMEGRTCFVIAHRLSTVRRADAVLVLDNGRVVEQGTHDDLIRRRGAYYRLHMIQTGAAMEVSA